MATQMRNDVHQVHQAFMQHGIPQLKITTNDSRWEVVFKNPAPAEEVNSALNTLGAREIDRLFVGVFPDDGISSVTFTWKAEFDQSKLGFLAPQGKFGVREFLQKGLQERGWTADQIMSLIRMNNLWEIRWGNNIESHEALLCTQELENMGATGVTTKYQHGLFFFTFSFGETNLPNALAEMKRVKLNMLYELYLTVGSTEQAYEWCKAADIELGDGVKVDGPNEFLSVVIQYFYQMALPS